MSHFLLLDDSDVQQAFAALAARSGVPAPTIKKFELTGQISFRQLLLLWQSLDDLSRLFALTQNTANNQSSMPTSIEEVLKDGF